MGSRLRKEETSSDKRASVNAHGSKISEKANSNDDVRDAPTASKEATAKQEGKEIADAPKNVSAKENFKNRDHSSDNVDETVTSDAAKSHPRMNSEGSGAAFSEG